MEDMTMCANGGNKVGNDQKEKNMGDSKCPHCGGELRIPINVEANLEAYGGPSNTITECCGKMVTVFIHLYYTAIKSDRKEDDWGMR